MRIDSSLTDASTNSDHRSLFSVRPFVEHFEGLKMPDSWILFLTLIHISGFQFCYARIFTMKMHHRFSEPVKKWSQQYGGSQNFDWPTKGSAEYYSQLANHDKLFRQRRRLADSDESLTFADGNETFRISSLGFLHYTTVTLGTPGQKFMVALDTGSDLFWVPCDCIRCASIDTTAYTTDFTLSIYNSSGSSTSRHVTCNSSLCIHRHSCPGIFSTCPYSVSYVSSETSTSGILVEDVLHLETEDNNQEIVEAFVTFGCGQVQSGSFLDIAAPNGLFGLGLEKISVPSILSREGYTADSFSMCFGHDGTGRISFGDQGSLDQDETPFYLESRHPSYKITVTELRVGAALIDSDLTALFDSGTSFTYLVDPLYTRLSERFHAQTTDKRHPHDSRIPFEYCYEMSPDANTSLIPSMTLTMKGGGQLPIFDPIIVISTQREVVYCLAVIKSAELSIIGQNFMTGYRIIFDRENLVLGWKKSNCSDIENINTSPSKPMTPKNVPPAVAAGIGHPDTPKSIVDTGDRTQSSVASPFHSKHIWYLAHTYLRFLFLLIVGFLTSF